MYRLITLCNNYWLPVPVGSFIVLTQPTKATAHMHGGVVA